MLGVGMIMGDGVLTPAISVVSAIEGLGQIPGGGGNIERSKQPLKISTVSGCSLLGFDKAFECPWVHASFSRPSTP